MEKFLEENQECTILCLTEHWKTEDQLQVCQINNFQLAACFCRGINKHGGAAIYCQKGVKYKLRKTINELSIINVLECAAIELIQNGLEIIIVTVYRPSGSIISEFLIKMEEILTIICNENKNIIVNGDFNIELKDVSKEGNNLLSLFESFNLVKTINDYTRVTPNCQSCLDNIFTNLCDFKVELVELHVSDHRGQIIELKYKCKPLKCKKYFRIFEENKKSVFNERLKTEDWSEIVKCNRADINLQWKMFMTIYMSIFNECFPSKLVNCLSKKKIVLDDNDVNRLKNELDILYILAQNNLVYKEQYNSKKKQYDKSLIKAKQEYYSNKIRKSGNKSKSMWNISNELMGKNNKEECQIEGNPENVVNMYNNYLIEVTTNLSQTIPNIPFEFNVLENEQTIYLDMVTPIEIVEIAGKIKNKYSSGDDELPTTIMKESVGSIKEILAYIVNNSLKFGVFPDQLKLAMIIPIHKSGTKTIMENYRPISLLPSFSKIFEVAYCSQVIKFLTDSQVISINQHGYMPGKSTMTAIYQFIQNITDFMEKKYLSLGIFLDLSKAYDCLDRNILLMKLEKYGIRGNALQWASSYFANRKQRVCIQKQGISYKSSILSSNIGVPQGSIAGPIFFIVYMNDLCNLHFNEHQFITNYADDTNLLCAGDSYPAVVTNANDMFKNVKYWFQSNKLILNESKTKIVMFRTRQLGIDDQTEITIDIANGETTSSTKFLGIIINENLNWSEHVDSLASKLNSVTYAIRTLNKTLNSEAMKVIYHANFESVAKYGIIFWGCCGEFQKIFIIQKRIIRVICGKLFRESCRSVFYQNNIMTIIGLYIYECLMFFFKNRDQFGTNYIPHGFNTRTKNVNYPIHRLQVTENSPQYKGIKFFNKLPDEIKIISGIKKFKREVKKLIIKIEPYTVEEYLNYRYK